MAKKVSEQRQETINQLIGVIEAENSDGYGGVVDGERFLLWSTQSYFRRSMSDPPSVEELLDRRTDGRDDLGLDLYFVDDDEQIVYMIQSKFRSNTSTIKRPEIDSFLALPSKLVDRDMLNAITNHRVLRFAYDFKDLVARGFEIRLVYLTTESATNPIKSAVDAWNNKALQLSDNRNVIHDAEIVGADELLANYSSPHEITHTSLKFVDWYISEQSGDNLRYLNGEVEAEELVRVFNKHKFNLFRLNPRGPLGNTNVNRAIMDTLSDDTERRRFYFLNNGLTAVCEAFSENRDSKQVQIQDLQIVNGCQTTWNIYYHDYYKRGSLEGVSVNIKLIEVTASADTLSHNISQASNSQSPMRDWDFLFNEQEQLQLQDEFQVLADPIFYELKRGEQKFIFGSTRIRKTTIKDVAQAMWAFIGHPSEAKDKLRDIPRSYKSENSVYRRVFFEGVTARHLVLPLEVHNRVKQEWKNQEGSVSGRDAGDARLHIVWLIGQIILKAANSEEYKDIGVEVIDGITSNIGDWFADAYFYAKDAINDTHDFLIRGEPGDVTERQLFRSVEHYNRFSTELDRVLRNNLEDLRQKILGPTLNPKQTNNSPLSFNL